MSSLFPRLMHKVLELTVSPMNNSYFDTAIEEIHNIMHSTECSLWSVNRNTTIDKKPKDKYGGFSTSVICRRIDGEYNSNKRRDYVHKLDIGLFRMVMETAGNHECFRCDRVKVEECRHRSMDFVNKLGLNDFISIPIHDQSSPEKIIAILELSFKERTISDGDCRRCATALKTFFTAAFQRHSMHQKDELQKEFNGGDVKSFFNHLINYEFKKIFDYQGSSFFIWDSYSNVFRPIASTDKKISYNDLEKAYSKDVKRTHTGRVGATGKPIISDKIGNYTWYEQIDCKPQTSMIVPILDPANFQNVIGIVRFLNKKNRKNPAIIDYFNDIDLNLIQQYAQYLSLIVYFYNKEQDQVNLISKLAHEFKTPANAISKSAKRLLDSIEKDDYDSLQKNLKHYLENIADFANVQRWQAESTLYSTRSQQQKTKYKVKECLLLDILFRGKSVARPIARLEGVRFDNIKIHPPLYKDLYLNVDETAFVIVLYNLLTNAIKYRYDDYPDSFHVDIWYKVSDVAVEIRVEDYGIGIEKKDKESIFQVGYRGERAMRESSSGFGVGLYVVKQIITDFGGNISVVRTEKPTTFEILLPKTLIA